jgi:hypothetical protein
VKGPEGERAEDRSQRLEIRIWERENRIKDKIYVVWAKIDLNESTLPYQSNPFPFFPERQGIL